MDRPNFLVIMSDQHRGDCLGVEGHPVLLTPTLDAIARRGVRFSHAYSTCPVCIPARRSLLSGQYPASHGMVGMVDHIPWYPVATLPGELRKAGYQTVLVGRDMHQHPRRKRFGFDHMVHTGDVHPDDVYDRISGYGVEPSWNHGLHSNGFTARPWHLDENLHPSNRTVDAAIHFLRRRDPECPFFLVASFAAPHPPFYPPRFYFDRYVRTGVPNPVVGEWKTRPSDGSLSVDSHDCILEGEALLSCRAGYYGLINHMDDQIQRLLNPATGLDSETLKNTIILYISDHGEMLGDHYLFRKSSPYEAASRIPLLMKAPERFGFANGTISDAAVSLEDIMPTLLELAGVSTPVSVDGESLVPLLKGDKGKFFREWVHGECSPGFDRSYQMLTNGKWKYIWWPKSGQEQLFDLDQDPNECHDLADARDHGKLLGQCRITLVERLKGRPEGYSDGKALISGKASVQLLPHVSSKSSGNLMEPHR